MFSASGPWTLNIGSSGKKWNGSYQNIDDCRICWPQYVAFLGVDNLFWRKFLSQSDQIEESWYSCTA